MNAKTQKDTVHFIGKMTGVTAFRVADAEIHLERGVDAKEFKRFAIKHPQLFESVEAKLIAKPIVVHVVDTDIDIEGYELVPYRKAKSDLIKKRRAKLALKQALRNARGNRSELAIYGPQLRGKSNVVERIVKKIAQQQGICRIELEDIKFQSIKRNGNIVVWPIDKE